MNFFIFVLQVKDLFHCSMSTIIKGAVVMPEELFAEILSVSWELLLEWDYQLTSAAGNVLINKANNNLMIIIIIKILQENN